MDHPSRTQERELYVRCEGCVGGFIVTEEDEFNCDVCEAGYIRAVDVEAELSTLRAERDALKAERDEARGCPHGDNCACAIGSRHFWLESFCKERDALAALKARDTWHPPASAKEGEEVWVAFKSSRTIGKAYRTRAFIGSAIVDCWCVNDDIGYVPFSDTLGWCPLPAFPEQE